MAELESRVIALKERIRACDGDNVANVSFRREVEALIDAFYEDIGEIRTISLTSLFDLFLIKTLYVQRQSRDFAVLDYLGGMLSRYLFTAELAATGAGIYFLSELAEEIERPSGRFQNLFEAYRRFGDNALFIAGVFPRSFGRRRRGRGFMGSSPPMIDQSYFTTAGRAFYRLAAGHELAEETDQRLLLQKLAEYFPVYREALEEASDKYILGFDMERIADMMLDNFNAYRRTKEEKYLDNARKYAAILKLDEANFPALFRSGPRAVILEGPDDSV